ncbi:endonuclease subunit [Aeromonas phage 65]|uniref:Endonuclease subunit n=1 Tax=Aeromonas phage 65 TaxID=2919549 RepID=Q6RHU5_9CAUD|nr:SbcC-like subunit of palindrome specific endonuclease [Aeromonas phage 65]AAR90909.1 endonuclease subunit [Aeromonas phage 65]
MNITFNYIEYKNIMSVGSNPIRVQLDLTEKTLVTGTNGAGKSTMIEALSFLLYGKSYRKLKKEQLINQINKKNLLVSGEVTIGNKLVHIERGMKPNVSKTIDGEPIPEAASATEYQRILEEDILNVSHESFKQLIVLGTAGYTPFMELKPEQRRTMVEDLLQLSVLGQMNKLNNVELKRVSTAMDLVDVEIGGLDNERKSILNSIEEQKKSNDDVIEHQSNQIRSLVSRVKLSKENIEKLNTELDGLVDIDSTVIDEVIKAIETNYSVDSISLKGSIESDNKALDLVNEKYDNLIQIAKNEVVDESIFVKEIEELKSGLISEEETKSRINKIQGKVFDVEKPSDTRIKEDKSLSDLVSEIQGEIFRIQYEITEKKKALANFDNGVCPTCGTDVSDGHDHVDEIRKDLAEAEKKLSVAEQKNVDATKARDDHKIAVEQSIIDFDSKMMLWSDGEKKFNQAISGDVLKEQREISEHNSSISNKISEIKVRLETISGETSRKVSALETAKSSEVIDLKTRISENQAKLDRIDLDKEREINAAKSDHNRLVEDLKLRRAAITHSIKSEEKSISENSEMAKQIKSVVDSLKEKTFTSARLDEVVSIITTKQEERENLFNDKFSCGIMKDMLKDDAIKGEIVKRYIPIFNSKINEYLSITGADYVFSLNESFEESIKSRGRDEFTYMSFSQGEKARINIALLFTWRYIASMVSGTNISMLILDEIFDGGMDSDGVYAVNRLLNEIGGNTFIISHRVENRDDSFTSHIKMTKKGRFTEMERE